MDPPLKTARAQIELFAFQWELIRSFICNTKRPSVKQSMKWQVSSNFQIYPGKTDSRPPSKTARALSEFFAVQCHQWEPIWNSQLIRKYKEIPVHIENIEIPKSDGNFQIYLGKTDDRSPHLKVSNSHNSFTSYTALHAIQLFVLSFGVELLDRSVIHLFLNICQLTFVVVLLIAYCCCCVLHNNNNKHNYNNKKR